MRDIYRRRLLIRPRLPHFLFETRGVYAIVLFNSNKIYIHRGLNSVTDFSALCKRKSNLNLNSSWAMARRSLENTFPDISSRSSTLGHRLGKFNTRWRNTICEESLYHKTSLEVLYSVFFFVSNFFLNCL